jgi:hypothetical protein
MKRAGRLAWLFAGIVILFPACSRQPVLLSPNENAQSLPFNDSSHGDGVSPTQAFAAAAIPTGTVIVIRLQSSLSSAGSHSGDLFQAVLDEPIVVQGQTLAPSGTAIIGRVLAVKASKPHELGYLRLTLSSMVLNGKAMDVLTSSVFSKGGPRQPPRLAASVESPGGPGVSVATNDVQFSTGRRMTFRLIQPLPLHG